MVSTVWWFIRAVQRKVKMKPTFMHYAVTKDYTAMHIVISTLLVLNNISLLINWNYLITAQASSSFILCLHLLNITCWPSWHDSSWLLSMCKPVRNRTEPNCAGLHKTAMLMQASLVLIVSCYHMIVTDGSAMSTTMANLRWLHLLWWCTNLWLLFFFSSDKCTIAISLINAILPLSWL